MDDMHYTYTSQIETYRLYERLNAEETDKNRARLSERVAEERPAGNQPRQ